MNRLSVTKGILSSRLLILAGHAGVGKTELAVNLAVEICRRMRESSAAKTDRAGSGAEAAGVLSGTEHIGVLPGAEHIGTNRVVLVDLDIVSPYFRALDRADYLKSEGIEVIGQDPGTRLGDLFLIPAQVRAPLDDSTCRGIIDVGGDGGGAKVLASLGELGAREDVALLYLVNAARPRLSRIDEAVRCLREIEAAAGMRCRGIVGNTHYGSYTTPEDLPEAVSYAQAVADRAGVPLLFHAIDARLAGAAVCRELPVSLLPIEPMLGCPENSCIRA